VRSIVAAGRQIRSDVPIIARADSSDAVRALYGLGIQEVTSPEFEAAIEMTRQALMFLNVPAHEVLQVASAIRHEQYGQGRDRPDSGLAMMAQVGDITRQLEFAWLGVPSNSSFDGRTLADLRIRTTIGASVVGIIREGSLVANPDGEARLEKGDLVAVLGTGDQLARFARAIRAETGVTT
jgi:CPA2 family monovalent cation:H+ antiporter-2